MSKNLASSPGTETNISTVTTGENYILKLLRTDAMMSLARFSPFVPPYKNTSVSNLVDVCLTHTEEEWRKLCEDDSKHYSQHNPSYGYDLKIVTGALENIEQLRVLWSHQMITDSVSKDLFFLMQESGKVSISDLKMTDKDMLGYNELQMQSFIQIGVPINAFCPDLKEQVEGLLNEDS